MAASDTSFSAEASALGYFYQIRYALFQAFRLPEQTTCYIEKDDDIDFTDPDEGKLLASLKHKAPGDTLTDLSPDFWKSVRIWLSYYLDHPETQTSVSFFLFTTGRVSTGSFLEAFLPSVCREDGVADRAANILKTTESKTILKTKKLLEEKLSREQWPHFFRRITIFDQQERIQDIPQLIISQNMRAVRPQFRSPVYQRLEGWWVDQCIKLLTGQREDPLRSSEVSEMLSSISEQFRDDNLPIEFREAQPREGIDPNNDSRTFVLQLKAIGVNQDRVRRAILDYYRAFEQRASWVRQNVTLTGEIELYDDRLVEEWTRLKEIIWEGLRDDGPEQTLQDLGRQLLNELSTSDRETLRIRTRVIEPYVSMGSFHMLANENKPRVHWHPRFLERMGEILEGSRK